MNTDLPIWIESPHPFWLVWSESGGSPAVKHQTQQLAQAEAERLAHKYRERIFYVMRSESQTADIAQSKCREDRWPPLLSDILREAGIQRNPEKEQQNFMDGMLHHGALGPVLEVTP